MRSAKYAVLVHRWGITRRGRISRAMHRAADATERHQPFAIHGACRPLHRRHKDRRQQRNKGDQRDTFLAIAVKHGPNHT